MEVSLNSGSQLGLDITEVPNRINKALKKLGGTMVEQFCTGKNQNFLLVQRNGSNFVIDMENPKLDVKHVKIKFNELVAIGKELACYLQNDIEVSNNGEVQGLCQSNGNIEMFNDGSEINLGYMVTQMNVALRKLGSTTVEDVYNGNNKAYILVHHKGHSSVIHIDEMLLDTRFVKVKYDELLVIGQELAQYEQTAVAVANNGEVKGLCQYVQDTNAIRANLISKLFSREVVTKEPFKAQITEIVNNYYVSNNIGGSLNICKSRRK